jgi:hypothetical protein
MPTWFCARSWFNRLGCFDEIAKVSTSVIHLYFTGDFFFKGHCEDLTFFFKHLRNGIQFE